MKTIYQLQLIADRLRAVTEVNSISPEDTFGLQADVLEYLADMEQNAEGLGIHKVYASYAAMVADASAPVGSNGKALRFGQLVVIYDSNNTTQAESGNVYAWQKGNTGAAAWLLMGNLGSLSEIINKLTNIEVEDNNNSSDLEIGDENGNVLARFSGGHIKTKNFDSADIKTNIEDNDNSSDLEIGDENGNVLARFSGGHIKTKNFDSAEEKIYKTAPNIEFHLPNDVPVVKITSTLLSVNEATNTISPLTENKNAVGDLDLEDISLEFSSKDINFTDFITISYQGQTSIKHPKKGFTVDFKNKHKFGDWLEFDSFHLKGYYVDWMHSRDWVANRLLEQMWISKDSDKTRPYMAYNDFNNDFRCRTNINAFCHVDAFPVELFINDVYWGLYTFRIKKDRDNYFLTKKNSNHIQLDPEIFNVKNFNWEQVEIRNPKGLTNLDGTEYDGDNPKEISEGDVKTHILDFINKFQNISESSTKDDWKSFINTDSFIDAVCLYQFICGWDCFYRNTLYTTWDGVHWSALPYDMDSSFGYGFTNTTDWSSTLIDYDTDIYAMIAKTYCHWLYIFENTFSDEIKARYKELKENGIFTVDNIVSLFNQFSKTVGYKVYSNDIERWDYPTNGYGEHGFYDSIKRIETFIINRIIYLNNKYK